MRPKDLENEFEQMFSVSGHLRFATGRLSWTYWATKYRLEYNTKYYRKPHTALYDSVYIYKTSLYYTNEHGKYELLDQKQWNPQDTVIQIVLWVTEIILNRDTTT